ncbi:MAG: molybdopterin-dependent oxidoreductase [Rhodospirillaceae bacterium]|nr:molybdopterin-dependent oxidoreductase [Rhodospirillaceae bacterium]MBT5080200.1 molybdopterin-dependent oxidoreductase [Rhodospirillaceae bacterium]MBT5881997.1 molybdopterin-dependent oxidoreductase [Rhodospirillaceae bacterium]MBT7979330.1 molybdopterin-dependent oxidoreductase [Rhodospirillaceae bacterium]
MPRVEDPTLLRGLGRFADDLPTPANACHAAFLRSPIAHGEISTIDTAAAAAMPGVVAVITGADLLQYSAPFITGVKVDAPQYALAIDRVRYVGEPVAMVLARDRYLAEDALDAIVVDYQALPPVVDPVAAVDAPALHPGTDGNVLHDRYFRYGDPEDAFATAAHVVEGTYSYPRNSCTPMECFCVIADYDPGADAFEVMANFQGPYTLHTIMARSLKVPGNRMRLKTPPFSGGSYGVKQAVFPYVVALGVAARIAGRPVKWLEDRLEHLAAATSATNRVTTLRAALDVDGRVLALDYDQLEDCGAFLRAPEPATIYRMHGNMTGAYAIENLAIHNRVVVTNKTPTGLMRGFGGPQIYFPLERLMDKAAARLGLDPLELRRRNLVPTAAMPYRTAPGALLDSGDYAGSIDRAVRDGGLAELIARRDSARAAGRMYGIGMAVVVEPSISNMGYITTLLSPEQRERSGPKNGALATATVAFDPSGAISVAVSSVPQGQGHRTVLAQVVADVFACDPGEVAVATEHDTAKDPWTIASGNYASRFAGAVAGATHTAALQLRDRLSLIAAADLNIPPEDVAYGNGRIFARGNPDNSLPLGRSAAKAHWSPLSIPDAAGAGLRETAFWNMPELAEPDEGDRINSSGAYGFIFDYCGVEVDPETYAVRIDRYVTMHDAGRLLNPMLADGQIRGGFAQGMGAALLEELCYAPDGSFQAGTLADYLAPTAMEIPELTILHDQSPSPFTPLGAKGLGEGNCMSTPVCIANAVADAVGEDLTTLPLTRSNLAEILLGEEAPESASASPSTPAPTPTLVDGHALHGSGGTLVPAAPVEVWELLLDDTKLAAVIPGCHALTMTGENAYRADVTLGVGPVKGRFVATVALQDLDAPRSLRLVGGAAGPLGTSRGEGWLTLTETEGGTQIDYTYTVQISGKVAAVGGRMMDGAARALINQFFKRLVSQVDGREVEPAQGLLARLLSWLGIGP